jgi:hypothetical protein
MWSSLTWPSQTKPELWPTSSYIMQDTLWFPLQPTALTPQPQLRSEEDAAGELEAPGAVDLRDIGKRPCCDCKRIHTTSQGEELKLQMLPGHSDGTNLLPKMGRLQRNIKVKIWITRNSTGDMC